MEDKNKKTINKEKKILNHKKIQNKKEIAKTQRFKEQYFSYYDDVKDFTKGQEDW